MTQVPETIFVDASDARDEVRARILAAAIELLASGGRDAVTTRAVAASAGVQAPTLYRLFGDKRVLLDAVAEHGFTTYLKEKAVRKAGPDPVEDLRRGWDLHIEFGLTHPAIYLLMCADPRPDASSSPAATASYDVLRQHVRRVAVAGRLRVSEERAAHLIHASGCGTVLTLLAMPPEQRDLGLSKAACEAVLAAITLDEAMVESGSPVAAAVALRALLPDDTTLTRGERQLLGEWLERLAAR